ncbi:pyridoxamine phosphate oxidase family protein [Xylaria sp. CBS 124048]|nr:pyridoxamine phosphate oxidase family protein [Xylaria sp. CBS 124048]
MGAFYEEIPAYLVDWILTQKVFWVATAPLSGEGHVNLSPKGGSSPGYFGMPNPKSFWYMDMTGSGNETISHLTEPGNGRITILFNAFEGPPRIVRLWGKGKVLENGTREFDDIVARENVKVLPGTRSVIVVDIHQSGTSCGYQVPFFSFVDHRRVLEDHYQKKAERFEAGSEKDRIDRYWAFKNAYSIDGLPGLRRGLEAGKKYSIAPMKKMAGKMIPKNGDATNVSVGYIEHIVIAILIVLVAVLAATHPAFEDFPARRRIQDLLVQVTTLPGNSPRASPTPS